MAILSNEIIGVGKYLTLDDDREKVEKLLNCGFFMNSKTIDEMRDFINTQEPIAPVMSM